jgi:hypothetical protein
MATNTVKYINSQSASTDHFMRQWGLEPPASLRNMTEEYIAQRAVKTSRMSRTVRKLRYRRYFTPCFLAAREESRLVEEEEV